MSDATLNQAIELIKSGQTAEAQRLLEPLLEADPCNIPAWLWYVDTWPTARQKIKVLELCLQNNPDHSLVKQALASLQAQQPPALVIGVPAHQPPTPVLQPPPAPSTPGLEAHRLGRGVGVWPVVITLAFVAVCLIGYWIIQLPPPNRNALAIRDAAKVATIDIPIRPPVELDFKSKAEVLKLREEAVYRYPDLLAGDYEPSEAVFGQMEDNLPWWGLAGQFFLGNGERSIEGASEEARFILNPYLLLAVEFDGLYSKWEAQRVTSYDLLNPNFPLYCEASQLRWRPGEARAEVTYDVSQYMARLKPWASQPLTLADFYFSLLAYNARDLNLSYMFVSYSDSRRITKLDPPAAAYAIPHYLHRGGSCGYPGGCNNMSPDTPEISWLEITGLPAEAVIRLWRQSPSSIDQTPDMVFVIHLK